MLFLDLRYTRLDEDGFIRNHHEEGSGTESQPS